MKIRIKNISKLPGRSSSRASTARESSLRNLINSPARILLPISCPSRKNQQREQQQSNPNPSMAGSRASVEVGVAARQDNTSSSSLGGVCSSDSSLSASGRDDDERGNDTTFVPEIVGGSSATFEMKRAASATPLGDRVERAHKFDARGEDAQVRANDSEALAVRNAAENVLCWLLDEAPGDLTPLVMSFLGSRKIAALSLVNKRWREMALSEPVWRTACEDIGKWKQGDDIPRSWLQLYRDTPCVPVDYNSIESALSAVSSDRGNGLREQCRSVRVLVRPGRYMTRETVVVHTAGFAEVTIETVDAVPADCWLGLSEDASSVTGDAPRRLAPGRRLSRRIGTMRRNLSCRSLSGMDSSDGGEGSSAVSESRSPNVSVDVGAEERLLPENGVHRPPQRATIVLKTRKQNRPAILVRQGRLKLKNVNIVHNCHGMDIWNGNSAVQIQPPFDADGEPVPPSPPSLRPTAIITKCDIMSVSGRGIVAIDGAHATIKKCHIHHCAATGVYIGGPGSVASLDRTDVVRNGNGNESNLRGGIARGHSGVYLEQGVATIRNCNVSSNSLTGLSAISGDNATLHIENSDLIANGTMQLEMPPAGSASRSRSTSVNNTISGDGIGRSRSGLMECGNRSSLQATSGERDRPQSPVNDAHGSPFSDRE